MKRIAINSGELISVGYDAEIQVLEAELADVRVSTDVYACEAPALPTPLTQLPEQFVEVRDCVALEGVWHHDTASNIARLHSRSCACHNATACSLSRRPMPSLCLSFAMR